MQECPICKEDLIKNKEALICAHMFHKKCLQLWLKESNTCPICRTKVGDDAESESESESETESENEFYEVSDFDDDSSIVEDFIIRWREGLELIDLFKNCKSQLYVLTDISFSSALKQTYFDNDMNLTPEELFIHAIQLKKEIPKPEEAAKHMGSNQPHLIAAFKSRRANLVKDINNLISKLYEKLRPSSFLDTVDEIVEKNKIST